MSKRAMRNCSRCGAVLRADAEVCVTCCAPQSAGAPRPSFLAPSDLTQIAASAASADLRSELAPYSAQSSTHILGAVPAQREPEPRAELESVPPTGPNPFLAAARIQHARDEAALVEGYPV